MFAMVILKPCAHVLQKFLIVVRFGLMSGESWMGFWSPHLGPHGWTERNSK